jgi:hypothetical protein
MEHIRLELEKALNNSFPMRGLKQGWCYAGNFYVNEKKYAYYGTSQDDKVTCRCMEHENYANHWFDMNVDYEDRKPIITVGECIG